MYKLFRPSPYIHTYLQNIWRERERESSCEIGFPTMLLSLPSRLLQPVVNTRPTGELTSGSPTCDSMGPPPAPHVPPPPHGQSWHGSGRGLASPPSIHPPAGSPPPIHLFIHTSFVSSIRLTHPLFMAVTAKIFGHDRLRSECLQVQLVKQPVPPPPSYDRGEPAISYRQTGWVWEIILLNLKTAWKLPIILGKYLEFTPIY